MLTIFFCLYGFSCIFIACCYQNHKEWQTYSNATNLFISLGMLSSGLAFLSPTIPWYTTLSTSGFWGILGGIMSSIILFVVMFAATVVWADKDITWDLPEGYPLPNGL